MHSERRVVHLSSGLEATLAAKIKEGLGLIGLVDEPLPNGGDIEAAAIVETCRALILDVPALGNGDAERQKFAKQLNSCRWALDRGVLVVFVVTSPADIPAASRDLESKYKSGQTPAALPQGHWRFDPYLRTTSDVANIVQLCAHHWPGPAVGTTKVTQMPESGLPAECELLLKRAFRDAEKVFARRIKPTNEASNFDEAVYRVQPFANGRELAVVFIVKFFLRPKRFNDELGNFGLVEKTTPFPYAPPVSSSRCVAGGSWVLLVSHLVDRAVQFDEYIASHSPAVAIASLFDGPLRCWHTQTAKRAYALGEYLQSKGIAKNQPQAYQEAYERLLEGGNAARDPQELLAALKNFPPIDACACLAHGDLHLGNLRVRDNTSEVVLIDFGRSESEAPLSRDPAELEVSLGFEPMGKETASPLAGDELERLYTPPLLSFHNLGRHASPRALAIEQIRRQVSSMVNEREYLVMVAGHCMFYAAKFKKWPQAAAAAYQIADRLLSCAYSTS